MKQLLLTFIVVFYAAPAQTKGVEASLDIIEIAMPADECFKLVEQAL
jgi:hypothetical protein